MWQPILQEAIQLHKNGSYDKAEKLYLKVLSIAPDHGDALHLLGLLYSVTGRGKDAHHYLEKAASLFPDNPLFLYDLGVFYYNISELEDAEIQLNKAISLQPDHVPTLFYLGNVARKKKNYLNAERFYKQAFSYNPEYYPAICNLGTTYSELTQFDDAIACFEKALSLAPRQMEPYNNLGLIYAKTGEITKALSYYRKAHQLNSQEHRIYSNILMYSHYLSNISNDEMFSLHQQFQLKYQHLYTESSSQKRIVIKKEKLRIGYVSADFRIHSVGYFIEPIVTSHDKKDFEIFCYSDTATPDETTERIRKNAFAWRSIYGIDDNSVFSKIQEDKIDILVDLAGHTEDNRLPLFLRKPAPIQVTYLGYPNTTGLETIDYRLTDALADPDSSDKFYTEKLIRLETGFLCYRPPDVIPAVNDSPALRNGHITFGSFNNLPKINEATIKVWADILTNVPDSKLFLKTRPFNDTTVRKKYEQLFIKHGISVNRLIFKGHNASTSEHLNEYNVIDIALDPFPYNGTTTTFESLLMGVPVITLAGTCHAGRVGVSILNNFGIPELIAHSNKEYIEVAINMTKDITTLNKQRQNLRDRLLKSKLCNGKEFTKNLEKIYRQVWNTARNKTN